MKKTNWKVWIFFIVLALAFFLRVYHFNDWLIIKSDQVRDAGMILHSFEDGPLELPLLGPRAGGTFLRLGPIFYYFQYFSALIFRNPEPPMLAYPNLLFSLLSVPLFYFFSRLYFNKNWSMIITGLFSLSFLGIEYSRFAWNPNSIPFFVLAFLYSLLKIFDTETKQCKTLWFAVAGVSFSIASQLHFSSFLALPIVGLAFLAIHYEDFRRILRWKQVFVFLGIVLLFYIPVILSDALNNGDNARQFISSISDKSSHKSLIKNISKDGYYFGKYFLRILTGYFGKNILWHKLTWIFIFPALFALWRLFRKETEKKRRDFLSLCVLLFLTYFIVYIPLARSIDKPRFFLPVIILPFIFIGFMGKYFLEDNKNKKVLIAKKNILAIIIAVAFIGNVYGTVSWLKEMRDSQARTVDVQDALILKTKGDSVWWTWGHFQKISEHILKDCSEGEIYFMMSKNEKDFMHPIAYALENKKNIKSIHKMVRRIPFDIHGCYYYIFKQGDPADKISQKMNGIFKEEGRVSFGSASVLRFSFANPPENKNQITPKKGKTKEESEPEKAPRRYWKDVMPYFKL